MSIKNLFFSSAVRGFHVNKRNMKPEERELLKCSHEEDNLYVIFSMKVCKPSIDEIASHLPMLISRITKFIMVGGVSVTVKIIGKYNWRSHLVQSVLEGLCEMMVMMSRSVVNHLFLTRYEKGAKRTLYRTKEQRNCLNFPFSKEWRGKQAEAKSRQQKSNREERRSEIKGHLGVCYQPQDKKRITKKIIVRNCLLV